jgi:hypothetical protein
MPDAAVVVIVLPAAPLGALRLGGSRMLFLVKKEMPRISHALTVGKAYGTGHGSGEQRKRTERRPVFQFKDGRRVWPAHDRGRLEERTNSRGLCLAIRF